MGKNTAFFGGKSVNRVDPIDTNLSYRGRINKAVFEHCEKRNVGYRHVNAKKNQIDNMLPRGAIEVSVSYWYLLAAG